MKHPLMKLAPVFVGFVVFAGCDDSTAPSTLVGSYTAIEFVTTGTSGQTNQLLAGSSLIITLASNHTTSGHLHVVASGSTPAVDADLTGTWAQSGNSVTFSQPAADTFVENMTFTAFAGANSLWDLEGSGSFSGTAVRITLRQGASL